MALLLAAAASVPLVRPSAADAGISNRELVELVDISGLSVSPDGRTLVFRTERADVGRNSYFFEGWLPPDPPTGHGEHRYAFQVFALDLIDFPGFTPGRGALVEAMKGSVLGAGILTGLYSREAQEDSEGSWIQDAAVTV